MDRSGGDAAVIFMPGIVCQGDKRLTWAKYAVLYTEVAGTASSFKPNYARTKKVATAYTIENGVFKLVNAATKTAENIAVGDYLVNVTTSNNTATSGSTLCKVTGNSGRKWVESVQQLSHNYDTTDAVYGYPSCKMQDDGTFLFSGTPTQTTLDVNSVSRYSNKSDFTYGSVTKGPHSTVYGVHAYNGNIVVNEMTASKDTNVTISYTPITLSKSQGAYIGEVKANEGTYPENGIKDGYWYVLLN